MLAHLLFETVFVEYLLLGGVRKPVILDQCVRQLEELFLDLHVSTAEESCETATNQSARFISAPCESV